MSPELLHPTICPVCGCQVEFTTTLRVYGRSYGSGWCYHCTGCGATSTTNKLRPDEATSILADRSTKIWRHKCHDLFDQLWCTSNGRRKQYAKLAKILNIPEEDCHFGFMNREQLIIAYREVYKLWFQKFGDTIPESKRRKFKL